MAEEVEKDAKKQVTILSRRFWDPCSTREETLVDMLASTNRTTEATILGFYKKNKQGFESVLNKILTLDRVDTYKLFVRLYNDLSLGVPLPTFE